MSDVASGPNPPGGFEMKRWSRVEIEGSSKLRGVEGKSTEGGADSGEYSSIIKNLQGKTTTDENI